MTERELIESANAYAKQHGQAPHVVMTLQESKGPVTEDAFSRLGLNRDAYAGVARPSKTLAEVLDEHKTAPEIPAGTHQKLLGESIEITDAIRSKLANAF